MVSFYYRSLRNNRTRIHKNLFVAMVIQVVIRLTLYIDQALVKSSDEYRFYFKKRYYQSSFQGIDNTVSQKKISIFQY